MMNMYQIKRPFTTKGMVVGTKKTLRMGNAELGHFLLQVDKDAMALLAPQMLILDNPLMAYVVMFRMFLSDINRHSYNALKTDMVVTVDGFVCAVVDDLNGDSNDGQFLVTAIR